MMIFRLEDVPNELLWLILEYIPSIDLFYGFFNLNQRINTILRLIHYRFNLLYINKNQFNFFQNTILPNIECSWIQSYYINDITNRIDSITICKNLRSLTIHDLHTETINLLSKNVLPELKQLNYLYLYSDFVLKDDDIQSLTNVILSQQMPLLTYCYLAFQDFSRITFDHLDIENKSLSLKTLIIDQWCRLRDFINLLYFIPNIQRLTVRLFDINTKGMMISSLNTIDDFTILVPHLIYLRAKLSQISFLMATKTIFLRLPSTLRELSLSTWTIDYSDGNSWESLLSTKFPHLKHFRLIISLDKIPSTFTVATNIDLDNIVKSFNQSKYFHDHHWNVLLNVNERDRLKFVLHTNPYPIENFQTTLCNIRRCTSTSTQIQSAYSNVKKLTLTLLEEFENSNNDYRNFAKIEELNLLSNLTEDYQEHQSNECFNHLKNMINLSNIKSIEFPEETRLYPTELINKLFQNLPKLKSLTLSHLLYVCVQTQPLRSLKALTLIFSTYSSISPPMTRMRYLLPFEQILTNDLILELVRTILTSFPELQTLTFIVRDLDRFENQFSEWLKENFLNEKNISYDLLSSDKLVRFYF